MTDQAYSFLVAGGLVLASAYSIWLLLRLQARDRAGRAAREERARAALIPSGSEAFDAGAVAALNGVEVWTNPYCKPSSRPQDATAWAAGWCYGRQVWRDSWRAED